MTESDMVKDWIQPQPQTVRLDLPVRSSSYSPFVQHLIRPKQCCLSSNGKDRTVVYMQIDEPPDVLTYDRETYEYVGCQDGTSYYKLQSPDQCSLLKLSNSPYTPLLTVSEVRKMLRMDP